MFKFFKINKKNNPDIPQADGENQVISTKELSEKELKKKREKSKKNGFMSIIPESSIEEVFSSDFKENKPFIAEYDGKTCYFGFIITGADSNVLGKKSLHNEDVGTFVKQMQESAIVICENQELLDDEKIFICPNSVGMMTMGEILYLHEIPFYIAYITEDFNITDTGVLTSWDEINSIFNGVEKIDVLVKKLLAKDEPVKDKKSDESDTDNTDENSDEDISEDNSDEDNTSEENDTSDEEVDNDSENNEDVSNSEESEEPVFDDTPDEPEFDDTPNFDDTFAPETDYYSENDVEDSEYYDEENGEYVEDEPSFDLDDFRKSVSFEFFSGDLDLKISTDHFDALFVHWNEYNRFPTDREDGWINKHLNELSKEANHELAELHNNNLLKLREKYQYHVNEAAQEVAKDVDLNNSDNYIGKKKAELDAWYKEREEKIPEEIVAKRELIKAEYDEECEKYVKNAADSARRSYQERHLPAQRDRLESADSDVRNALKIEFEEKLRDINEERRSRARRQFDDYLTDIQKGIGKDYAIIVDEETRIYKNWRDKMSRYVDENRKDEAINNKVRLEELTQTKMADKVREEMQNKIDIDNKLFESKLDAHKKDLEMLKANYEDKIAFSKSEIENAKVQFNKDREALRFDLENMTNRYQLVRSEVGKEFEARLKQAEDDKIAWSNKYDTLVAMHKKNNGLYIALAGVAIVASLTFGVIMGTYFNLSLKNDSAVTESINKFDEKLKQSDENSKKLLDSINKNIEPKKPADDKSVTDTSADKINNDKNPKDIKKPAEPKKKTSKVDDKKVNVSNTDNKKVDVPSFNSGLKKSEANKDMMDKFYKNK